MTPQEKAQQLIDKMVKEMPLQNNTNANVNYIAKQCALIAVDEMYNIAHALDNMATVGYLSEVIKEIEKL